MPKFKLIVPLTLFLFYFVLLSQYSNKVFSASFPEYTLTKTGESIPNIKIKEYSVIPELSTIVKKLTTGYFYVISSANSIGCTFNYNLAYSQDIQIPIGNCSYIATNNLVSGFDAKGKATWKAPSTVGRPGDFKHTYDGITGVQFVNNASGMYTVALRHGEHQNTKYGTNLYQGYVYPKVLVASCAADYTNGVWQNCGPSFNTFASLLVSKRTSEAQGWNPSAVTDYGPVVWPEFAMRNATTMDKEYPGPYHPTLFADDNYLYVYYSNFMWDSAANGGYSCYGLSRAPKSDFTANNWRKYYNGGFNELSVPAGFRWDWIDSFYSIPGGKMSCIGFPDKYSKDYWATYFNIAKIRNTNYYIAVEERQIPGPIWQIGTRLSTDLVNWSTFKPLISINGSWGVGTYSYPTFLDKFGNDQNAIDPDDFYIMGKHATNATGYETSKMRLSMNILIPYSNNYLDVNNDNVVDLKDVINILQLILK